MMRSFLQFVGFASTVVWSTLLLGTILIGSARADAGLEPAGNAECSDCYGCNATLDGCTYSGNGRNCTKNNKCSTCTSNNGNNFCATASNN